jgi:TPR repeat protein
MLRIVLLLVLLSLASIGVSHADETAPAGEATAPAATAPPEIRTLQDQATHGDAKAQFKLAGLYATGEGIEQDWSLAVYWYQRAAIQGDPQAQLQLGECLTFGRGVAADKARAAQWFHKAARQGNLKAQVWLANSYFHGWGVKQDNRGAYFWALLATNGGDKTMIPVRDQAAAALDPADVQAVRKRVQEWEPTPAQAPKPQ